MASSFQNGVQGIPSFTYHSEPRARRIAIMQDIEAEPDVPLDAFDKELLAQCLPEPSQPAEYAHLPEYGLARLSLPPTTMHTLVARVNPIRPLRDDLHATPGQSRESSSSSAAAASSPTIAALQNRRSYHSSGSSSAPISTTGGIGRYKEHAGSTVTPGHESSLQSPPESSDSFQHSQVPTALGPQRGITRMKQGPPIIQGIPLVAATELTDRYRSIFPFPVFNAVQSKCYSTAWGSSHNLVVSAPTGTGKTAIMELAICRLLHTSKAGDFKVVYQAPTKSLCSERMRDWSGKFASLDLDCAELTGDTEHFQLKNVQTASIIITTPEKWDSVTRKWKDNARLMKMVKLFLIDEVHILKEARGATLEAVVSRMKSVGSDVRFVALSATVPNSEDIATWLGKAPDAQHLPAHREVFGENYRPVKLEKHVWAIRGPANDFAFDKVLNSSVQEAIAKHSRRKPTMIFCTTRKMAVDTAKMLANLFMSPEKSSQLWPAPKRSYRMVDPELSKILPAGVAFHHGGVDAADRGTIEEGFLGSDISIICCTSTLAVGVNLPCYFVIIKGTVAWTDKGIQECSDLEVMQMLGRAGRPQFESSACAVILTRPEKEQHYKKMVSGAEILESCLHLNLVDHLNSEIGLGTVSDITSAKKWLASTFMFVRLQKNPGHYRLEGQLERNEHDDFLESICAKDISLLQETRLVSDGPHFRCTEFGDAMARYYISFQTMKIIIAMAPKAKMSEIISTLAQAHEFSDVRFKSGEKALYKDLNGDVGIKFPLKVDIAQQPHKVSLLMQSELGGSIFPNHDKWKNHKTQFNIDKNMVFSQVNRLIRCIIDCQLHLEDSVSVRHALELARSLAARVWDNSPFQMKQIEAIGDASVRKLAHAGISSIETLQNTEPHRIEHILRRNPPFGQKVLAKAVEFPNLRVSVKQMGKEHHPQHGLKVTFKVEVGFVNETAPTSFRKKSIYVCSLAETSEGVLIDFRRFAANKLENGQEFFLSAQLTRPTTSIKCHVMCDEIAGTSRLAELQLEHFPASYFPLPEPIVSEPGKVGTNEETTVKVLQEFDVFDGLDDADLLAALEQQKCIEVIHDIDEIALADSKPAKKSMKRTADKISTEQEGDLKPYKEPVQLESGKWTCRHTCNLRGISCRHKCCVEGVEKPAKPGGQKLAKKDTSGPGSADEMTSMSCAKSTQLKQGHSQDVRKKQKPTVFSIHDSIRSRACHESTGDKEEHAGPAPSKMTAYQHEKVTAPKSSFMQNAYKLSNHTTYPVVPRAREEDEKGKDVNFKPQRSFEQSSSAFGADIFDFDVDDSMDEIQNAETTLLADQSGLPEQPVSLIRNQSTGHKPQACENVDLTSVRETDVIENVDKKSANSHKPVSTARIGDTRCHQAATRSVVVSDSLRNPLSPGLGNEADLGAFIAPLTHLASALKDRGPFITGESYSPEKGLPYGAETIEKAEDYADSAVEAFFATLEAADYDVANPPAKRQKLDPPPESAARSSKDVPELQKSSTRKSSFLGYPEPSRQLLATMQKAPNTQMIAVRHNGNQPQDSMVLNKEEEERMAREEQKKKWQGFENLYEQFGDYVEIID